MIALIAMKLMETGLGPRVAKLASWAIVALLALLALWLAYSWAWDRGRDHERAKWEAAAEILEDADAIADAEALDVAHETKETIDAQNDDARAAAAGSDDKLRAGLDRLRAQGVGGRDKAAE